VHASPRNARPLYPRYANACPKSSNSAGWHAFAYTGELMHTCSEQELASARELTPDASDAELLAAMAAQRADPAIAAAALEEFITRHRLFVFKVCRNLVDRYGTASGWDDAQFSKAVFNRIYRSSHTYRNIDGLTENGRSRRLKAWIGRIANNLLIDKHRRCRAVLFDEDFLKCVEVAPDAGDFPTETQRLLREAIQKLPDAQRLVIVRTLRYMQAREHQRLPNDVVGNCETSCKRLRQISAKSESTRGVRLRSTSLTTGETLNECYLHLPMMNNEFEQPESLSRVEEELLRTLRLAGELAPEGADEVEAAEKAWDEVTEDELPESLQDAVALSASIVSEASTVVETSFALPDAETQAETELARVARLGNEIPEDVERRMENDRSRAREHSKNP
jgi:DNA-directed RNA polymerase specialized sigma24 family protein